HGMEADKAANPTHIGFYRPPVVVPHPDLLARDRAAFRPLDDDANVFEESQMSETAQVCLATIEMTPANVTWGVTREWKASFRNGSGQSQRSRQRATCSRRFRRKSQKIAKLRLAEREGFEPSVEFPLHTLSKRAP